MKYQVLFYQKTMKKYSSLSSAAVVIGTLRVNSSLWFKSPHGHDCKKAKNCMLTEGQLYFLGHSNFCRV